jgi:hypothetical protein
LFLSDSHPRGLGAEALRRLQIEDFPVTVINDIYGGDLYEEGKAQYQATNLEPGGSNNDTESNSQSRIF